MVLALAEIKRLYFG